MAAADGSLTKHGFPRGYRFVPTSLELISILSDQIRGRTLPPPLHTIFQDVRILDYHPEELYERFKDAAEHRYIYFFSVREFQKPGACAAVPEDKDQKEPRPVRVARGGGWKPSGGGQVLRWPRKKGGFVAGRMVTMVFYDRVDGGDGVKSNWGMHEFLVPFYDLALYRLYILKGGDMESENGAGSSSSSSIQMMSNAYDHFPVSPCPPLQPWGISTGNYHRPLDAGASTSQMLPPPPQHPSLEHAQYYQYQQQHAFGAAAAPQAYTMPVHGAEFPGNMYQYQPAIPPAPVAAPTAAANAAEEAHATATDGDGQDEAVRGLR
ncbi:NAC domain-containing protein 72-like [Panicum hallii]|uniref:NAC domain-containing protein 72-like n=1 Tax=Panicum hallii TaxID=206008 RepID=UPI000DF4E6D1|nr:NAC domain-containing protein 72-like [Panicum hallii]